MGAAARQGFRQSYEEQKKDFLPDLGRTFVDDARWLAVETVVVIALVGVLALVGGLIGSATFGALPGALVGAIVGVAIYAILRFVVVGTALVVGVREMRKR